MHEIKKRGGFRPGSGRKPLPEEDRLVPLTLYLPRDERDLIRANGGTQWVRERLFEENACDE